MYPFFKRLFDIVISIIGLILFSPIFIITAVLIKLDSSGQIFYRGVRSGKNGKKFKIFKFRSMIPNLEKVGGDTTALNDPRITRVGRYIRKCKFDELPQLLNVLIGDMGLVGPRPELPYYTDRYTKKEKEILSL